VKKQTEVMPAIEGALWLASETMAFGSGIYQIPSDRDRFR
jgi:hypothetical protein